MTITEKIIGKINVLTIFSDVTKFGGKEIN